MGVLADHQIEKDVKIEPFEPGLSRPGKISYGCSSYGYDARIGYKFKVFKNTFCGEIDPKNFDEKAFEEVDLSATHEWIKRGVGPGEHWRCKVCETPAMNGAPYCTKDAFIRIPPNSFALGETLETFTIPRDCLAVCLGKSTYARSGIIVNVTPLEPEWHGKVTVEISNTAPLPARIYAGEGIMQVLFFRTDGVTEALLNAVRRIVDWEYPQNDPSLGMLAIEELLHKELPRGMCRTSYADKKGRYQNQKGLTLPFVEGQK